MKETPTKEEGEQFQAVIENLRLELRRGSLSLAVMAQLRTEQYGYTLRKLLADRGIAIDENTLYPLLRRLEAQKLLVSNWREENKRRKRFYRLSAVGELALAQLVNEWQTIAAAFERIYRNQPGMPDQNAGLIAKEIGAD